MEHTTPRLAERRGMTLLLIGGLLALLSPIASWAVMMTSRLHGWEDSTALPSIVCTASFLVGLFIAGTGFSQRAADRQQLVTVQLTRD
jgi:hypothetical protein